MSLARIYHVTKSRKAWTCGKCKTELPVGSPVLTFAVGFRGHDQRRCTQPGCYPLPSERESSAVASVYDAQERVDLSPCTSLDDLENAVQYVVEACNEVAEEYENSEMFDVNEDLQERADTLHSAADELESWSSSLEEEPTEDDDTEEGGDFESAHEAWIEEARDAAQQAIDGVELP